MTINEKKMASLEKEIEKIIKSLERYENILEKKIAKCEKLGCNWSDDEYDEIKKQFWARHEGEGVVPFGNDDDLITEKQNGAYFEKGIAEMNVEETKKRLANAERRYEKVCEIVKEENEADETFKAEYNRLSEMEKNFFADKRHEDYKVWVEEFIKECAKDGIVISTETNPTYGQVVGTTPNGKNFVWYINNGYTLRSGHCYTLRIDGRTIFTSGEWWRCYNVVKNN